jgi:Cystathionine beta-lyases/cystathionine gamma-synthases
VLGGALVGSKQFIMEKVFPFVRSAGPTLSAFNAWVLLKGMETLSLRVEKQSANALEIARWLERHPAVNRVFYPGLNRIRSMRWPCVSRRRAARSCRSN